MDIFDILKAISKRKSELVDIGIRDNIALKKAEFDISKEFHIPLQDIKRLYGSG